MLTDVTVYATNFPHFPARRFLTACLQVHHAGKHDRRVSISASLRLCVSAVKILCICFLILALSSYKQ